MCQDNLNELSIHRAMAHQTLLKLSQPFLLPELDSMATQFEAKIREAVAENIFLKGFKRNLLFFRCHFRE